MDRRCARQHIGEFMLRLSLAGASSGRCLALAAQPPARGNGRLPKRVSMVPGAADRFRSGRAAADRGHADAPQLADAAESATGGIARLGGYYGGSQPPWRGCCATASQPYPSKFRACSSLLMVVGMRIVLHAIQLLRSRRRRPAAVLLLRSVRRSDAWRNGGRVYGPAPAANRQ